MISQFGIQKINSRLIADLFPYLIVFALVTFPAFLHNTDMWDGVIISFAFQIQDNSGLQNWFFSSGWEIQYWLVKLIQLAAELLSLDFYRMNLLFALAALLILIRETKKLSSEIFGVDRKHQFVTALFVSLFPAWSTLYSSVHTIHIYCLSLGMLGVRLIRKNHFVIRFFGFAIIVLSFQLNSLLVLLPILSLSYDLQQRRIPKSLLRRHGHTMLVSLASIMFYFTKEIFNENTGLYVGYNSIFRENSFTQVGLYSLRLFDYATFLIVPMCLLLVALIRLAGLSETSKCFKQLMATQGLKFVIILVLFIAAIAPYILVDKGASLLRVTGWDYRHAFLLAPIISIMCAMLIQTNAEISIYSRNSNKSVSFVAIFSVAIFSFSLLSQGIVSKVNRIEFEKDFISQIRNSEELNIPAGKVLIKVNKPPYETFAVYEVNYLLFRATGRASFWAKLSSSDSSSIEVPPWLGVSVPLSAYVVNEKLQECFSQVKIYAGGFRSTKSEVLNSLGVTNSDRDLKVIGVKSDC